MYEIWGGERWGGERSGVVRDVGWGGGGHTCLLLSHYSLVCGTLVCGTLMCVTHMCVTLVCVPSCVYLYVYRYTQAD